MKIAIAAPIWTKPLTSYLNPNRSQQLGSGIGAPFIHELVKGYLERGFEVLVVSLDAEVRGETIAEGPSLRVRLGPYRARHRARDGFAVERAYVEQALRSEKPDIVHAHWTYEFAMGAIASGLPTLVTIHDWAPAILRHHTHPYRAVRLLMQAYTFRNGRFFTAVSPYISERARRLTSNPPALVPNGVHEDGFTSQGPQDAVARRPLVLSVNEGFQRRKNVTTLMTAFKGVFARRPEWRLVLIGGGFEAGGDAHAWARRHGVDEGVTFVGRVSNSEVQAWMSSASLLVHPSLEESFGMVLIEGMARGLPVVGGKSSGAVPWVLDYGLAGFLLDVRSSGALARGLDAVMATEVEMHRRAAVGRDRAWSAFRLSRVLDQYIGQYSMVMDSWGRGRAPATRTRSRR